jgi:hypothetical protein
MDQYGILPEGLRAPLIWATFFTVVNTVLGLRISCKQPATSCESEQGGHQEEVVAVLDNPKAVLHIDTFPPHHHVGWKFVNCPWHELS